MTLTAESIERFLDELASAAPTPGGGSAAALFGAMGAALIAMVCNVTLGKKGFEAAAAQLDAIRSEAQTLRTALTGAIAEDIAAFDALMSAYRLPKAGEADKVSRSAAIQDALREATVAPLNCARGCAAVVMLSRKAAELGFSGVISDAGVGVLAAQTGLRSSALNVQINAPHLSDRVFAAACTSELESLLAQCASESETVFALVRARL